MAIPLHHTQAVYALQAYQPWTLLSRFEALEQLENWRLIYALLHLYQTFFPQEFATSEASLYRREGQAHSDRDLEFFNLIDRYKFPLDFWTLEQAHEVRIELIPVIDRGIDLHDAAGIEAFKPEWQILFPLSIEGRFWFDSVEPDAIEWYNAEFGVDFQSFQHPCLVITKEFRKRCLRLGEPFKFLPMVLNLLDKCTGNVWLDSYCNEAFYGSECGTYFEWSEDSIRHLTQQWRQAQHYLNLCNIFVDWLSQDLLNNFNRLLNLWNVPYLKTTSKPSSQH